MQNIFRNNFFNKKFDRIRVDINNIYIRKKPAITFEIIIETDTLPSAVTANRNFKF